MFQIFSRKSYFCYILEFQGIFFVLNICHSVIVAIYSFSLVILMLKIFFFFLESLFTSYILVYFLTFSLFHVKGFSLPLRYPVLPFICSYSPMVNYKKKITDMNCWIWYAKIKRRKWIKTEKGRNEEILENYLWCNMTSNHNVPNPNNVPNLYMKYMFKL